MESIKLREKKGKDTYFALYLVVLPILTVDLFYMLCNPSDMQFQAKHPKSV